MTIYEKPSQREERHYPLRVAILGCSGSVGSQALDVCRQHPDKLKVVALSVARSTGRLVAAANEFGCTNVAVAQLRHGHDSVLENLPRNCVVGRGEDAVADLATLPDVDVVVNALVGFAGIHAGYAALAAGKTLAYANKESIVVGGDLIMPLAKPGNLIPVDSEHSAIFQCLVGERPQDVHKLWLTCSGGPFFGYGREELANVTPTDALAHPTWSMGSKITIDSATLMNKGLELIEAHHLFETPVEKIGVLVHRQSKIHSMVEFVDGVVKAQLGSHDMRLPIQYALSYPERWASPASSRVNWAHEDPLTLEEADEETFGCLALAKEAGRAGGTIPCALNAANEVANAAFRQGRCGFLDIERVVERVMSSTVREDVDSVELLCDVDARSRAAAEQVLREEIS